MKTPAILANSLGNIFEWYDFALYSLFSGVFTHLFFPTTSFHVAQLEVFGIFAVGFLCRPLGGLLFGHLGDRIGRIRTLRLSILVISIPALLMACMPTYAQIGIYAPILLIILRMLQGISIGGEFTGIIIYLTEMAPHNHRALLASCAGTAANLGILAAGGMAILLQTFLAGAQYYSFAWRIAFLVGAVLGMFLLYLRLGMTETEVFKHLLAEHKVVRAPIVTVFQKAPLIMLRTVGIAMLGSVLYYLCFIYIVNYFIDVVQLHKFLATKIQSTCILAMLLLVPLAGMLCDKLGRRKSFLLLAGGLLICAAPCFYLLTTKIFAAIILAMAIFTLLSSLDQGTTSATVVEQFPAALRYTGISISFNFTQAIFGGTSPLVAVFLLHITHNVLAPAYYLMLIAATTLFTVIFFLPETRYRSLDE